MKQGVLSLYLVGAYVFFSTTVSSSPSPPVKPVIKPFPKKSLGDCDCFMVSGPDPGYFQHYKLWDFRAVPLGSGPHPDPGEPDSDDGDEDEDDWDWDFNGWNEEHDDSGLEGNKQEPESDALSFFDSSFNKDWTIQQWERPRNPRAPGNMINSRYNVFFAENRGQREQHATYLVLRTTRHNDFTSTAEIETRVRNIYHCSIRVRLRILPADVSASLPRELPLRQPQHWIPPWNNTISGNVTSPVEVSRPPSGACVGIFTYRAPNCESDIEILTSDPSYRVRYANQPDYDPVADEMIPGASTVVDLPVPWTGWSTHRLDWFSEVSRWWVNDKPQAAKTYRVPNMDSRLVINLWSDGGVWTGDMNLGESIYLGIEYIELAYNRSSDGHKYIPPSQRHGGHQSLANVSTFDTDRTWEESWEPQTDSLTGMKKKKKHGKCKKGKKGRKCRKKHHKEPKEPKEPVPQCHRVCNIDDLQLGQRGVRG
jgi:hypothetical protein